MIMKSYHFHRPTRSCGHWSAKQPGYVYERYQGDTFQYMADAERLADDDNFTC